MGMVTFNNEVWLVQNKRTSELQYVLAEEWAGRVDVPPGVTSMPSNTAASWQLVQVIKPKGRLLTMKANEAVRFGFVNKVVNAPANDPYGPLLALYHASGQPTVLEDTWSGKIVEFLTSPVLTGILMLVGTLAIYLEFQAPGHIVPGVIGGLCFAVVFGSRFLIGMSDWWPIALFIVGIGLILLEVLVFTGHMVWAITGILMCFAALGALFLPNSPGRLPAMPSTPLDWTVFTNGLLSIAVAFVLGMISMIVATSYLRKLPIAGKLVLPELPLSDKPPVMSTSPLLRLKAGDQGVVHSMCRPVGKVRFGNDIVDAASEGEVLTAGQKVRVLRNDGNRIIIEKIS
jgi:membrane-bound serine protease (ClpP class)